jgi:WD40 repeat protein
MGLGEDPSRWKEIDDTDTEDNLSAITFVAKQDLLLTGDRSGRVKLWDTSSWLPRDIASHAGHGGVVRCFAVTEDGKRVAIGSSDGSIAILDIPTLTQSSPSQTITGQITSLQWSQDGRLLAIGSTDRTARIYDHTQGTFVAHYPGHSDALSRVCFLKGTTKLLSWTFEGTAKLFSILPAADDSIPLEEDLASIEWSPDGKSLGIGTVEGRLFLLDCERIGRPIMLDVIDRDLRGFRFGPGDDELLLLRDDQVWIRCIDRNEESTRFEIRSPIAPRGYAAQNAKHHLFVDRELQQFACVDPLGQIVFADHSDIRSSQPKLTFGPSLGEGTLLDRRALQKDWLAMTADGLAFPVKCSTASEKPTSLARSQSKPRGLIVSPCGEWVAVPAEADNDLTVLSLVSSAQRTWSCARTCPPCWLESGLLALIDRAGDLNIYDPKLPNPLLHTWPFKGSVQRMISGPLPNTLLTVTDSEVIELDIQSGTRRWTLPLEGLRIQDMVLCPKKEQLALAFTDGTVQVATLDVMRSARARKIGKKCDTLSEEYKEFGHETCLALLLLQVGIKTNRCHRDHLIPASLKLSSR